MKREKVNLIFFLKITKFWFFLVKNLKLSKNYRKKV